MSYVPDYSKLEDKNSPYYYGPDSTYKPQKRKPARARVSYDLDEFGLPIVVKPGPTPQAQRNNLTKLEDGSLRTSGGDVYNADGTRYTSGGVTYDLRTGQAINPATNKISESGYSITPSTGGRLDNPNPTPARDNMANSSELERYKVFVKANEGIARNVKPGQAGYEEIQAVLAAKEGGMSAEDILAGMEDSFGKTAAEVKAFNSDEGNEVLIGFDDSKPTGRNTEAPIPGDIPQVGTSMGGITGLLSGGSQATPTPAQNLTPAPIPGRRPFSSVALAGTEGGSQQRDLASAVPSVEPIADALDQSRAVTVDQSPTGKEFFNKYFNRLRGI